MKTTVTVEVGARGDQRHRYTVEAEDVSFQSEWPEMPAVREFRSGPPSVIRIECRHITQTTEEAVDPGADDALRAEVERLRKAIRGILATDIGIEWEGTGTAEERAIVAARKAVQP